LGGKGDGLRPRERLEIKRAVRAGGGKIHLGTSVGKEKVVKEISTSLSRETTEVEWDRFEREEVPVERAERGRPSGVRRKENRERGGGT